MQGALSSGGGPAPQRFPENWRMRGGPWAQSAFRSFRNLCLRDPWQILDWPQNRHANCPCLQPTRQTGQRVACSATQVSIVMTGKWCSIHTMDIPDSTDTSLSKLQEMVKDRGTWHAAFQGLQRVRHDLVTEQQHSTQWNVIQPRNSGIKFCMNPLT